MYSVLSLFPDLLAYGLFAPTILRLVLSILIFSEAKESFNRETSYTTAKCIALLELTAAGALFIGLFTQGAVLMIIAAVISRLLQSGKNMPKSEKYFSYVALAILLSLLVTGPGVFAVDMPL